MNSAAHLFAGASISPAGTPAPIGAAAQGERLAVDVISTAAGLSAVATEWQELERLSGPTSIFQSHAQISAWASHFVSPSSGRQRLHIAIVRDNGRAVLILPLVICRMALVRVARLAGDPVAQFSDLLLDPAADTRAAFAAALASVKQAGADTIVLRRVRGDSHLLKLAGDRLRAGPDSSVSPFADFTPHATYDDYLRTLSKKMRQGLRNRRNHIDREASATFELVQGGPEARRILAEALGMKKKWLIQRGAISSAFLEPATKQCLLDLADSALSGAVVTRLRVNGETAAIRFGFEYQDTHFAYMSAFDESFSILAPGKMLMEFYIAQFRERGIKRIDMLPPTGRHKTDWCRFETPVADYTLPLTLLGRLYSELYQERVRPALRNAWYRLPARLRSMASAKFVDI